MKFIGVNHRQMASKQLVTQSELLVSLFDLSISIPERRPVSKRNPENSE